jgi:hypothetical protein
MIFYDEQRAVEALTDEFGDASLARRAVDRLVAEGIQLPTPMSNWIRDNMPPGRDGFVHEDYDSLQVLKVFGPKHDLDDVGSTLRAEFKHANAGPLGRSKEIVFALDDLCLRVGAEALGHPEYYRGFVVIRYGTNPDRPGYPARPVTVNGNEVTSAELRCLFSDPTVRVEYPWPSEVAGLRASLLEGLHCPVCSEPHCLPCSPYDATGLHDAAYFGRWRS